VSLMLLHNSVSRKVNSMSEQPPVPYSGKLGVVTTAQSYASSGVKWTPPETGLYRGYLIEINMTETNRKWDNTVKRFVHSDEPLPQWRLVYRLVSDETGEPLDNGENTISEWIRRNPNGRLDERSTFYDRLSSINGEKLNVNQELDSKDFVVAPGEDAVNKLIMIGVETTEKPGADGNMRKYANVKTVTTCPRRSRYADKYVYQPVVAEQAVAVGSLAAVNTPPNSMAF
jgi:hypothetical protein